jgi:hypothetical protein
MFQFSRGYGGAASFPLVQKTVSLRGAGSVEIICPGIQNHKLKPAHNPL